MYKVNPAALPVSAHRAVYELFAKPVADFTHLHHLCRNTNCVNPDHLLPLSADEHKLETRSAPRPKGTCTKERRNLNRFHKRISPEPMSGCWLWVGGSQRMGYGAFYLNGRMQPAHRVSYEMNNGPIPDGYHVHHMCGVTCCVNPIHLELLTMKQHVAITHNVLRERAAKEVFCPKGHHYDKTSPSGLTRVCTECQRELGRARYASRAGRPVGLPATQRIECPHGHPYAGRNVMTFKRKNGNNYRLCRICFNARQRKIRATKRLGTKPLVMP